MVKRNVLLLIFSSLLVLSIASFASAREWYEGGDLHKATVGMWRKASYENRLATSGDWFNEITKTNNPDLLKKLDNIYDNLGKEAWDLAYKEFSKELEICVSGIAVEEKLWKPSDKVAEIASVCYISMYLSEGK